MGTHHHHLLQRTDSRHADAVPSVRRQRRDPGHELFGERLQAAPQGTCQEARYLACLVVHLCGTRGQSWARGQGQAHGRSPLAAVDAADVISSSRAT